MTTRSETVLGLIVGHTGSALEAALRRGGRVAVAIASLSASATGLAWAQAGAPAPHLTSELSDVRFVALKELPRAPAQAPGGQRDCRTIAASSEAGRIVAERGWAVTGDLPLGAYRAVSFAGSLQDGTSGTCIVEDGNVAVFDGSRRVALAYGKPDSRAIGWIVANPDGSVGLRDGDIDGSPIGNLRVRQDGGLLLSRLAAQEGVCGGRATIPNIRNQPIDKARASLAAKGWRPVPHEPEHGTREADLVRKDIVEVESCSGTGLGYCSFTYKGSDGTLSVTTIGEGDFPTVSDYAVRCR